MRKEGGEREKREECEKRGRGRDCMGRKGRGGRNGKKRKERDGKCIKRRKFR